MFVTGDQEGVTQILAVSVILNEDYRSIDWVMCTFEEAFASQPQVIVTVILTDWDKTFAIVLARVWPRTVHQLCTYHLSKNILQKICPLYCGKQANQCFREFLSEWWAIAKKSELHSQSTFTVEWTKLVDLVDSEYGMHPQRTESYVAASHSLAIV